MVGGLLRPTRERLYCNFKRGTVGKILKLHEFKCVNGKPRTLFRYLGIAPQNVGYGKVKPVFKKGRRTAYMGLSFKVQEKSIKFL